MLQENPSQPKSELHFLFMIQALKMVLEPIMFRIYNSEQMLFQEIQEMEQLQTSILTLEVTHKSPFLAIARLLTSIFFTKGILAIILAQSSS